MSKTTVPESAFVAFPSAYTQFRVSTIEEEKCRLDSYNRRDFYKVSLVTAGESKLLFANRGLDISRPALVFSNPLVPYSWEPVSADGHAGYFCIFMESFLLDNNHHLNLRQTPLFRVGGEPAYFLDDVQVTFIKSLFARMLTEADSDYVYKYDLIRSQLQLIIHEALKMQPAGAYYTPQNAASRITKLFLELLERQFPVDSPQFVLTLKKASEFAEKLSVHVNHLNAAVQEITGKSTTTHISERVLAEAKSLLLHTDWSIADIAFSLGFEYPTYFNNFFKKHTGVTPNSLRKG